MIKIGMMSFAHMHAASYAGAVNEIPNAQLVGIADEDSERGQKMADQYNTKFYPSYEALLAADIDAVIICPENIKHKELTLMAAKAGKHVMCEKPLATNAKDAEDMIKACKDAGVSLFTAFPCRFSPVARRIKAAIDEGQVGKILAIRGTNRGRCPWGWFVEKDKSGGGAGIDHTVHVTDLIRWLSGAEPVEVYAELSSNMYHGEFDDSGIVSVKFNDGLFASIDCSWSRPKSYPTWGDVTLEIIGEKGSISADLFSQNLICYNDETGRVNWSPWGSNSDLGLIKAYIEFLENGGETQIATGEDGLAAAKVAFAAYESVKNTKSAKV